MAPNTARDFLGIRQPVMRKPILKHNEALGKRHRPEKTAAKPGFPLIARFLLRPAGL
ncbi:MAG: hypothetical protein AAFX00_07205 [Pseudomonadota bacterium]